PVGARPLGRPLDAGDELVLLDLPLEFLLHRSSRPPGAPGPTRTGGLRFRKPLLYPAELRAQDKACRTRNVTVRLSHRPRPRRPRSVPDQAEDVALELLAPAEERE